MTIGPRLHAIRYDVARTTPFEHYDEIANVRVRCALPGWLQRMYLTIRTSNIPDAYHFYQKAVGHGIALYDTWGHKPIVDGWIMDVTPHGPYVTFECAGGWQRMTDTYVTANPSAEDTDEYLKNEVLTASKAPAIANDDSNIDATGTDMGDWRVDDAGIEGMTPQAIVEEILAMGTSSNEVLDFWLQSQPFDPVTLKKPIAYLKARSSSASIDWKVQLSDLADIDYSRNIWNLANDVTIYSTLTTAIDDASGASDGDTTITVDTTSGFSEGDEIEIELDDDRRFTTFVDAGTATTLTLNEALPHSAPDNATVWLREPLTSDNTSDSDSQSDYWTREYREARPRFVQSQGQQYASAYLNTFKDPEQRSSFTIGSGWVRDGNGARWPVWRMLQSPGYIRVEDFYPSYALLSLSLDDLQAFWTVALDYDHASRRMRVVPDAFFGDNRLDVILQRLGANVGQGVTT